VHVVSVLDCRRVPFQSWADGGRLREALAAGGMAGAVGDGRARSYWPPAAAPAVGPATYSSTGFLRAMAVAGRGRAARKSFVRLIFCVAAAQSSQRRPVGQVSGGRLAGSLSRCHTRTKS
jgi:hypothetical protein